MTSSAKVLTSDHPGVRAAAGELVAGLVSEPWGQVSASVYETARLVTLAPWLNGHTARISFLLARQRTDGGWGAPDGYALVPTLSATEALLTTMARTGPAPDVAVAAHKGLRALSGWLRPGRESPLPDLPAIEIIVPALVSAINDELRTAGIDPLPLPPGMDGTLLSAVRARLAAGAGVPKKILHCLEVAGDAARGTRQVSPVPPGTVGASPAATAAWLGDRPADPRDPALCYLDTVAARHGGPVPCGTPITAFERSWVLSTLAGAGIDAAPPAYLLADPAGPGLPPDADTTAMVLLTLNQSGVRRPPDPLWAYETATHFCTWPGEDGFSTSVNAHVLEAFGYYTANRPDPLTRERAAVRKVARCLCEHQRADGSWYDRWHASAYYATVCCALALHRYGGGASAAAVRRAVRWVLATQRADGSWGRWQGTAEETAYALQTLLLTGSGPDDAVDRAVARGYAYLRGVADQPDIPALWHDKDLYAPTAIVRSAVLAALHLAHRGRVVHTRAAPHVVDAHPVRR